MNLGYIGLHNNSSYIYILASRFYISPKTSIHLNQKNVDGDIGIYVLPPDVYGEHGRILKIHWPMKVINKELNNHACMSPISEDIKMRRRGLT